jgi:hypothetical protein
MRSRQGIVEVELEEEKGEKAALGCLLEHEKRRVKELTEQLKDTKVVVEEQKHNVNQLTDELMKRDSRVMQLEADTLFLNGDLQEKSIVEEQLQEKCMDL